MHWVLGGEQEDPQGEAAGRGASGRRSLGRETRPPPPALSEDAQSRTQSRSTRVGEEGGGPPSSTPPPLLPRRQPAQATPCMADPRPRCPSVHPPQRGGGCRVVRTRRPARGRQTGDPTHARASAPERGRGGGQGAPPRPACDGCGGGQAPAKRAKDRGRGGPRKPDTLGRGPGERQTGSGLRGTEKRRGAPTGCGHTRPTPRNRRRRWGGRAPLRGEWLKATWGRESAARAHRGISPPEASQHRGGPAGHPGRRTGAPTHLTGLAPTATDTPRAAAGRENTLPPHRGGPHGPHTRKALRPAPFLRARGHCSARGRHGRCGRHPREARQARS